MAPADHDASSSNPLEAIGTSPKILRPFPPRTVRRVNATTPQSLTRSLETRQESVRSHGKLSPRATCAFESTKRRFGLFSKASALFGVSFHIPTPYGTGLKSRWPKTETALLAPEPD